MQIQKDAKKYTDDLTNRSRDKTQSKHHNLPKQQLQAILKEK